MASERTVKVRLVAQIDGYRKAMREAQAETDRLATISDKSGKRIETASGRMVASATKNREAWSTAGTTLTAFGAAGVAALGLSAKAAIDWESAWAGVVKTVDGSADKMAEIEDGLRSLALQLPASQSEIADTASLLGQLGVQADSIVPLTKVMIDLGEATNLTAEQAATTLARMANIMGSTTDEVARMGATIVDLGNNSATTESEITDLALRLAAAGKQAGLSEANVFAFASALTSVGVEAEAGGTAMSKVITAIADAARTGNDDLTTFAQVAGVSASEFRRAFEEDASTAVAMFVEGLGEMSNAGESTTAIFDDLELTDQRLMRAVLSLGSAQGLLTDQVQLANGAWEDNTALVEEAEKRYETTEARMAIARNAINEAAITIGDIMLPAVANLADGVAGLAEGFSNLSGPTQGLITGFGALASVTALLAGGFLLTFPRVLDTYRAMKDLGAISPRVTSALGATGRGLAKLAGPLAVVAAGYEAIAFAASKADAALLEGRVIGSGEGTESLLALADGADLASTSLANLFDAENTGARFGYNKGITDLSQAIDTLTNPTRTQQLNDFIGSIFRSGDADTMTSENIFETLDRDLAGLVQSGALDQASSALWALASQSGATMSELREQLPQYVDALADVDVQTQLTGDATEGLVDDTEQLATQTGLTQEQLTEWRTVASEADASFISITGAYQSAIDKNFELAQSTADATEDAEDSWEDYYDGVSVSSTDYIAQLEAQVAAQAAWEENMLEITQRVNDGMTEDMREAGNNMIDELLTLGPEGAAQVQLLHDMTDAEFAHVVELWSQKGTDAVTEFTDKVESYRHPEIEVDANTTGATGDVDAWVQMMMDTRTVRIGVTANGSGGYTTSSGKNLYAGGGSITGAGTATSDSIPIMASNGEYMQNAAAHSFWGTQMMDALNTRDVAGVWAHLGARGFAAGGAISGASSVPSITNTILNDLTGMRLTLEVGGRPIEGYVSSVAAAAVDPVYEAMSDSMQAAKAV